MKGRDWCAPILQTSCWGALSLMPQGGATAHRGLQKHCDIDEILLFISYISHHMVQINPLK